jgi:hypothetical protein
MYRISIPWHQRPTNFRKFFPPTLPIGLGNFDQVLLFGDSTFCQFARQRPNKKGKYYFQPNLRVLGDKVSVGLNTESVSNLLQSLQESNINNGLPSGEIVENKQTALIVGSCLWDILNSEDTIQGETYNDHRQACRNYIDSLQKMYPNVTLIWKSPMACHSECVWFEFWVTFFTTHNPS